MTAQDRLDALTSEIAGIESEIAELTARHDTRVVEGGADSDDGSVAFLAEQIATARARLTAAKMRQAPLERALAAEQDAARAKVAEDLTRDADGKLDALEATLAQALEAAKALAAITDGLDENAALHWSVVARKAADAGGSPARRHLAGMDELHKLTDQAVRKLRHVAFAYAQRSVHIPMTTKSRAA